MPLSSRLTPSPPSNSPTLAIVEDPQPPAYTALSHADDDPENPSSTTKSDDPSALLTTTSIRRTNNLLRTTGGWTANFRGLACAIVLSIAATFTGGAVSWAVPHQVGHLIATLATVQLSTAWTHIVITVPSALPFWKRLPTFSKTFKATWLPVTAYWLATQVMMSVPRVLAGWFGLSQWDPSNPAFVPAYDGHAVWQTLLIMVAALATIMLLVIPAQVILIRVQASLLPADADTIVPFDRSFGGKVEPEVVTGRGYVDFQTAWFTFERASWIRLYKLLGKIVIIEFVVYLLFCAILVPEFLLMAKTGEAVGSA